jgi:hypothetical protein
MDAVRRRPRSTTLCISSASPWKPGAGWLRGLEVPAAVRPAQRAHQLEARLRGELLDEVLGGERADAR